MGVDNRGTCWALQKLTRSSGGLKTFGQQNCRDAARDQIFKVMQPSLGFEPQVVKKLFLAKNLDAGRVDQVQVSDQVSTGHADIGDDTMRCAKAGNPCQGDSFGVVANELLDSQHEIFQGVASDVKSWWMTTGSGSESSFSRSASFEAIRAISESRSR